MSLRKKTLLIVGTTFLVLITSLIFVSRYFVLGGFAQLETQDTKLNVQRIVSEFGNVLLQLKATCGDWAPWDDTYDFIEDLNENYIQGNLNDATIANLEINFMLFVNSEGQLVYGKSVDLTEEKEAPLPTGMWNTIAGITPLVKHTDTKSSQTGIIMSSAGPVFVASQPILNNNYEGPIRGALLVGRYLDAAEIERISKLTHLSFDIHPFDSEPVPADFQRAQISFSEETPIYVFPRVDDVVAGYTFQTDMQGKPAFMVKVEIPRKIFQQGRNTLHYYNLSLLAIGLTFIVLIMLFLEKSVLSPLSWLSGRVSKIGQTEDPSLKIPVSRNDELGSLAATINGMLQHLYEARKKLADQSYRSGMAEMASGVLHNIRNSLHPIVVNMEILDENLQKTSVDKIELARNELHEGNASGERRENLIAYSILANQKLCRVVQDTQSGLKDALWRISHVENLLEDHQNWAADRKPSEPVNVAEVLQDTVKLLKDNFNERVAVKIDPSVSATGTVVTHRFSLSQILDNLLTNAAESILRTELPAGEIDIQAWLDTHDNGEQLHLRIRDNGQGIAPEKLERIFERGFSTKSREASGLGLHWCANTVAALQGQLYAESEGQGKGACLHLLLPRRKKTGLIKESI